MKKGRILLSLIERSEYIVNVEVYFIVQNSEMKLLQVLEILQDNLTEMLAALKEHLKGLTVDVMLTPYFEEYKKLSFSDIGTVNVSKSLKKIIKKHERDHQIVHSLLVNKPNNLTKSWNFILVLVRCHSITDQILTFLVEEKIKKTFLTSLVNLSIINNILKLTPVTIGSDRIFVSCAATQIGKYLHVVVFINNYIHDMFRFMLSNVKDNSEEVLFRLKSIKNTISSIEATRDKECDFQYLFLNDVAQLNKLLFTSSGNFSSFFYKKLSLTKKIQDIKTIAVLAPSRFKVINTKLVRFSKLRKVFKIGYILNTILQVGVTLLVALAFYAYYLVSKSDDMLSSLEERFYLQEKNLLVEEKEHQNHIKQLNDSSKQIFYNLKYNKYPSDLLNVIKKIIEYNLTITNIEYTHHDNNKKLVLDIRVPYELSSRNKTLDKITNFFQYLKLNLPAHNEIRFYRDTEVSGNQMVIPVQIIIINNKP